MKVIYPKGKIVPSSKKVILEFADNLNDSELDFSLPSKLAVPVFIVNDSKYVLVHHLSQLWAYSSSYHLISKLIKHSSLDILDFFKTNSSLNEQLLQLRLINCNKSFFYVELRKIYRVISNQQVFLENEQYYTIDNSPVFSIVAEPKSNYDSENDHSSSDSDENEKIRIPQKDKQEKVTIGQVFPNYGYDDLPLNHANFNCLTNLSKFNFYKAKNLWKFLPNNKLSFEDRELVLNNHLDIYEGDKNDGNDRKQPGRSKKNNTHVDPNTIDLSESVIPGQGYVQEFNVNHLCKVPNYYVTSSTQPSNPVKLPSSNNSLFENIKMSKNIQLLVYNNDPDAYNLSKYFYTKTYRGPGSGNYKDAALMNRINRIPLTNDIVTKHHKVSKDIKNLGKDRYNHNLKGFVHDKFNKYMVDHLLKRQREYTEDYNNMEMLHNNLLFNLLINTYRSISKGTWNKYYKFKMIDHEQLNSVRIQKQELEKKKLNLQEIQEWKQKELQRADKDMKEMERLQRTNFERQQLKLEKIRQRQHSINNKGIQDLEEEYKPQTFKPTKPIPPPKQVETINLDIANRFTLPSAYKEITKNLPVELRSRGDNPSIKGPISSITNYADPNNPQILNRIEIIKLPNPNEVGWENLRKFKSNLE